MGRADSPFQDCRALEIGAGETRGQPALDRFSQDLTARARAGEMAQISGRERRRMTRTALRARPDVGKLFILGGQRATRAARAEKWRARRDSNS
ncbi:hypothetical protein FM996_09910 [Methylosinus sporium]|uniref:Uncharacterized protein n=1 Tax=Methylosinus sporium TaxID=428 RepID=A0A549SW59_METSR|nr:hypothetical protein FM996_09910 [Methylosinus sporium]